MTKEKLIEECLKMPDSYVDYPYDPTTAVVRNKEKKTFALVDYCNPEKMKRSCGEDAPIKDGDIFINLKFPPIIIHAVRDQYKAVLPGYYSDKNHWNTIILGKDVPLDEIKKMIQLSYDLVAPKVKKK